MPSGTWCVPQKVAGGQFTVHDPIVPVAQLLKHPPGNYRYMTRLGLFLKLDYCASLA
jgi:hypothetical protein